METSKPNVASPAPKQKTPERKRIPMSVALRKLEVPELPGYHLHWFLESRVPRAIQGGYTLVQDGEVPINQRSVGTDSLISGNGDLGGGVKIVGGTAEGGGAEYLVLMKIPQEWFDEDQAALRNRHNDTIGSIFKGEEILGSEKDAEEDEGTRYVNRERTKKALFSRTPRKA